MATLTRRRLNWGCAAVVASAALAACGFTPLYAEHGGDASSSSSAMADLAGISIRPLADRPGMRLNQVLRADLQPRGPADHMPYTLDITLTSRVEELGIRKDATSSRANFIMAASFYLSAGNKRVFGDRVQSVVGYNILDDQFATVSAQADAQERAIREISAGIKTRLSVYFRKVQQAQAG